MVRCGLWSAARLSVAIYGHSPSQTVLPFSTAGRPPLLGSEPTGEAGGNAAPRSEVGRGLRAANPKEAGELNVGKSCKDRAFRKETWRKFRAEAAPSSGTEEFRNLRNDDFPKEKARAQQKPFPIERAKGFEILFGVAPCSLALARAKRTFRRLFLKAGRSSPSATTEQFSQLAKDRGIPVQMLHRKALDALCKGGVHQGVCMEATPLRPIGWRERASCGEVEGTTAREGSQLLWLALDGIMDPMNLGAVLRSAHFLGVDGIVMSKRNSCPLTPVVSKASSGAMEVLDVFGTDDLQGLLQEKSEQGWELLGTVGHAKAQDDVPVVSCVDFRWTRPTILVLGNEGYGLSPETSSLCQKMLTISPGRELPPGIESLNVSVAAGIILHTLSSQRN